MYVYISCYSQVLNFCFFLVSVCACADGGSSFLYDSVAEDKHECVSLRPAMAAPCYLIFHVCNSQYPVTIRTPAATYNVYDDIFCEGEI